MFAEINFNIWAIIVSVIVNMVLGALWYSPLLFGNIWLRLIDKRAEDISKTEANKSMSLAIIPAVLSALALAVIIGISGASSMIDALIIGSLTSIAFSGMSLFNLVLFENRKIGLTVLNAGYSFASYNIIAVILTLWR